MTTETENKETTKEKKAPPIADAILKKADGTLDFNVKAPVWAPKKGSSPSFEVKVPGRYVLVYRKPKSQPAAEGKGA
jgi:hypothetical protein